MEKAVKQTLLTLVNSTRKHLKDVDKEQLKARVDRTFRELYETADGLEDRGHTRASAFIIKNARFMVTFAELALEDLEIPYTTKQDRMVDGRIIQTLQT